MDDHQEVGLACDGQPAHFVPRVVCDRYWTEDRIRTLRKYIGIETHPAIIRNRYLLVFSILVVASLTVDGSLDFFDELVSYQRDDSTLPWTEPPNGLQSYFQPQAQPVFQAFSRAQWSFCPVLLDPRKSLSNTRLDRQSIFSFNDKKDFGESRLNREALVCSVAIHPRAHEHLPSASQV